LNHENPVPAEVDDLGEAVDTLIIDGSKKGVKECPFLNLALRLAIRNLESTIFIDLPG
jgi:hypothetical protein